MTSPDTRRPRPNVFVVGDAKCGTTSLYRLLQLTEGAGTSRTRKELHFFSAPEILARTAGPGDDRIPPSIVRDEATYLAEYAHLPADTACIPDVSPSYLQNPAAAARIHAFAPMARIVILLREPAAKVFSQYVHLWSEGRETLPFAEAVAQSEARREADFSTMFDYAAGGTYAEAVNRYLRLFGPERVFVGMFEEMFGEASAERARLAGFLGLAFPPGAPPRQNVGGRITSPVWAALLGNQTLRRRVKRLFPLPLRTRIGEALRGRLKTEKPQLEPELRAELRRRFAPDVARLETLLGRSTGWPAT